MAEQVKQTVYDMYQETQKFLDNVEVTEHPAIAAIPDHWELIPIEEDKIAAWAKR